MIVTLKEKPPAVLREGEKWGTNPIRIYAERGGEKEGKDLKNTLES